jgi:hypothetical protein
MGVTTVIHVAKNFNTRLGPISDVVWCTNHECYLVLFGSVHSTKREKEL